MSQAKTSATHHRTVKKKPASYWAEASQDLRRELKETLDQGIVRSLHRKQTWRHLAVTLRQFLILGVCTWLLINYSTPWIVLPAAVMSGFTVFNFTVLLHEELHRLIFTRRRPLMEAFLGYLYAFWSGISRSQFTRWHLDHHSQLGDSIEDPKRHHLSPKRNSRLVKISYFTPVLFFLYFRAAKRESMSYPEELRSRIRRERLLTVAGHAGLMSALFFLGSPAVWLRAYALPVFIVFPVAFALNRLGQHYNIKEEDPAGWTTRVRGNWFWDFMFLNSNYHLEHHYYPGVPFYNLPKLQRLLEPVYLSHGLRPFSYADLLYGYIVLNNMPHTEWDFV